jgi:hypothetical protein
MSAEAPRARADAKAADLARIIKELQAAGKTSLRAIAAGLNDAGVPTARGEKWSSPQVMRILERLDPFREEEASEVSSHQAADGFGDSSCAVLATSSPL